MDDDMEYKTKEEIIERSNNYGLECYPELLELYLWKTGCAPEYTYDYSEMTGEEFFYETHNIWKFCDSDLPKSVWFSQKILPL